MLSLATHGCINFGYFLQLRSIAQGIITHMTDVKPLLAVATYVDDDTGYEVYQTITGKAQFLPRIAPKGSVCKGDLCGYDTRISAAAFSAA